ncbi:hypothetical protein [Granulicella sp. L60]|uniref:hypothetical protein n=1 Tax=Granulicella sp. L60 TaxID=1641866 RepID=UPI00131B3FFD|nr:hypothetical protein [Granulicella sp. L60]
MSTTANTRWTVIPRGLTGNSLTFAVFVSAVPVDPGTDAQGNPNPPPAPTDVIPWNNWLTNCAKVKDLTATLYVQIGQGNQPVQIPVKFEPSSPLPYDFSTLWLQLLAYSNTQLVSTEPAQRDGTSTHLLAAKDAAIRTTHTQTLRGHLDRIHAASILAMGRRRSGIASAQALGTVVKDLLTTRLGDLSYLALPASRGVGDQLASANYFRQWLRQEVGSGDAIRALNARAAERNLYRLADNPYNTLDSDVFALVVELAGSKWPGPGKTLSLDEQNLQQERSVLIEHAIFHRRYQAKPFGKHSAGAKKATDCPSPTPATINDFYRTLTLLSHYPELLPSLWLAFTFSVDVSQAALNNQPFHVAFRPPAGPPDPNGNPTDPLSPEANPPYTSCTEKGFPASSAASATLNGFAIAEGMLLLNECEVITRDIDGEALRATQNTHVVRMQTPPPSPDTQPGGPDANPPDPSATINPDESHTLPMRSVGVSLIHKKAATHSQYQMQRAFELRNSQAKAQKSLAQPLYLELADLVRGYTLEVWRNNKWSSLTSRTVNYTFPTATGPSQTVVYSEGHFPIEPAASTTMDSVTPPPTGTRPGLPDPHQAPVVASWAGWGATVDTAYPQTPQTQGTVVGDSCAKFPILTDYTPPAKKGDRWERLRYDNYKFRLRAMDMLCECMDDVSTFPPNANPKKEIEFCYRRSDPVHGPTLLLQVNQSKVFVPATLEDCFPQKKLPGESMGCVVLRDKEFQPHSMRVLVPPVAALDQLIPHGVLDDGDSFMELDKVGSFHDVAIGDDGNFPVVTDPPKTPSGASTNCYPYTGAKTVVPLYVKSSVTPPSRTYLPDPMAQRLAVEMIDLSDPMATLQGGFDQADFYPGHSDGSDRHWPNAVRLAVQMQQERVRGKLTAVWQPDDQNGVMTLLVGVPPGWQARLLLKCVPTLENAKRIFELPHAVSESSDAVVEWLSGMPQQQPLIAQSEAALKSQLRNAEDLAAKLALGQLDQVTPATEILLIHAVRQPLRPCAIDQPVGRPAVAVVQYYDSPKALLTLTANVGDRRSTGKVELIADWTDIVDSPPKEHDKAFTRNVHVQQWPLSLQGNDPNSAKDQQKFTQISQTFPDTNYRVVHLSVNAISRFENLYESPKPDDDATFSLPGDAKDAVQVTLLNTARLDPPRLNRIIPLRPAFQDKLSKDLSRYTVYGAAYRIYLERPWQGVKVGQGGQGEQLGITLWGEDSAAPIQPCYDSAACFKPTAYKSYAGDTSLERLVTRWGADPGLATGPLESLSPLSSQFLNPRSNSKGTTPANIAKCAFPAELPLVNDTHPESCDPTQLPYFTLASYPVHYDEKQRLWYADVQLSTAPAGFIRFGLTRYQPQSKINRECSRVTVAPLTPIPPHRELYFRKESHHQTTLQICGTLYGTNATGVVRHFEIELQYHRLDFFPSHSDRWEPAPEQPNSATVARIYADGQYPVLNTYLLHTKLNGFQLLPHSFRVVVREYETLFADNPNNRGLRTIERRLVDTQIVRVP